MKGSVGCHGMVYFLLYLLFVCEYIEVSEQLKGVGSSVMWDLGVELRSSGLAVSASTH